MATALQHIENHWNSTVVPSILEQYKDSEKWQSMLKAVIDQMQIAEDAAAEFMTVLDFNSETPTGYRLDFIAGLVNVTRMAGETDEMFFTRFVTSLGYRRVGTPDFVINSAKFLSQDQHPQYMDEAPATFFVYTGPRNINAVPEGETFDYGEEGKAPIEGGTKQLLKKQVKPLAPAGVLGLVGCALQLADGSLLGDAQGRLFMIAGRDDDREKKEFRAHIIADSGQKIITSDGKRVVAVWYE